MAHGNARGTCRLNSPPRSETVLARTFTYLGRRGEVLAWQAETATDTWGFIVCADAAAIFFRRVARPGQLLGRDRRRQMELAGLLHEMDLSHLLGRPDPDSREAR